MNDLMISLTHCNAYLLACFLTWTAILRTGRQASCQAANALQDVAMATYSLAGWAAVGFFYYQCVISLLHTNKRYDKRLQGARYHVCVVVPYWFIIPLIGVQKAYNTLIINKTLLYEH